MQTTTDAEWQAEMVTIPLPYRCNDCGHRSFEVTWFGTPAMPDLNRAAVDEKYRGDLTFSVHCDACGEKVF